MILQNSCNKITFDFLLNLNEHPQEYLHTSTSNYQILEVASKNDLCPCCVGHDHCISPSSYHISNEYSTTQKLLVTHSSFTSVSIFFVCWLTTIYYSSHQLSTCEQTLHRNDDGATTNNLPTVAP